MVHKLRFHSAIPDDLVNALDYYEEVSPKLANRFRECVDRRLDEIAKHPELFPVDVPPIRFAKIDRFPYLIFFAEKSDLVFVIGRVALAKGSQRGATGLPVLFWPVLAVGSAGNVSATAARSSHSSRL